MERTISVRGTGTVRLRPDTVRLTVRTEVRDLDFTICMTQAQVHQEELTAAVERCGFRAEDLKTVTSRIHPEYETVEDRPGHYTQAFSGFCMEHELELRFPLDPETLGAAFEAVSACGSVMHCSVNYELADPDAAREQLLAEAARDARRRAEILCSASGVRLGELLHIGYQFDGNDGIPAASCCADGAAPKLLRAFGAVNTVPDDICLTDSAEFIWAIS